MFLILLIQVFLHVGYALESVPTRPPMYPLAVRTPYLSTWIKGSNKGIAETKPEFWFGQPVGWTGLLRVKETTYSIFGAVPDDIKVKPATQLSQSYTASTTSFKSTIDGLVIELIFSNPVIPTDYRRQSIPFSYLEVTLSSFSKFDSIELYFDVNGEWMSGNRENIISWEFETNKHTSMSDSRRHKDDVVSHKIQRTAQLLFSEIEDMAEWGELYWSTDTGNNLTTSTGLSAQHTRQYFAKHGRLSGTVDTEFRPINSAEPVFAFAKVFKASNKHQSSLFTIGLVQDQVLQVNLPQRGYETAYPLFQRYFNTTGDMIAWHFHDYQDPTQDAFSRMVHANSSQIDETYASITEISTLQAIGGTQLVINLDDPDGEPHLWMKEISSNGNMQTSDVLYPAFPFFLYANPKLAVALLEPLLIHQEGQLYPHKYAMHDMGAKYPNATGHPDGEDEYMPVEECGNNLIMMLATHDALLASAETEKEITYAKSWLTSHYEIALQWSQYLIEFGLITETQLCTDDFAGQLANQTNLAVKAIVGIKSMSVIAHIANHSSQACKLDAIASEYVAKWLTLAYEDGIPFAKLAYQWKGSWGSLYNLYGDKLLDLDLFPESVYERQDAWYSKILEPYGLPLDSRHLYTKSDWQMFIASISSPELERAIYTRVKIWIDQTTIQKPLIDLYDTVDGVNAVNMFTNRPVVGGHFARLAMLIMTDKRELIRSSRHGDGRLCSILTNDLHLHEAVVPHKDYL